jgi:WD40 repeat protein
VGYGGSFHLWSKNKKSTTSSLQIEDVEHTSHQDEKEKEEEERWFPVPFIGGHFGSVNDLAWWSEKGNDSNTGSYLITASSDQTCRLFAPLKTLNTVADNITNTPVISTSDNANMWKEVSRPQIHGYDLNCVALEPCSHVIYTGGEEKIIRVFDAPQVVLQVGDVYVVCSECVFLSTA